MLKKNNGITFNNCLNNINPLKSLIRHMFLKKDTYQDLYQNPNIFENKKKIINSKGG